MSLADAEFGDIGTRIKGRSERCHQNFDALTSRTEINATAVIGGFGSENDVFNDREIVSELEVLMDHTDTGNDRLGWSLELHRMSVDGDRAVIRLMHAVQRFHQGRFTRPVFANNGVNGSRPHHKFDCIVCDDARETFANPMQFNC